MLLHFPSYDCFLVPLYFLFTVFISGDSTFFMQRTNELLSILYFKHTLIITLSLIALLVIPGCLRITVYIMNLKIRPMRYLIIHSKLTLHVLFFTHLLQKSYFLSSTIMITNSALRTRLKCDHLFVVPNCIIICHIYSFYIP